MNTVSIIIPCYNSARYVARTIDSVLAQTYTDWELILIDDASTDETPAILAQYVQKDHRISFIKNPQNLGISKTRNRGISLSKGTYIAMIDSDDLWLNPNKLSLEVEALDTNPKLGLVGTWMVIIDENDHEVRRVDFAETDAEIRRSLLYRNHFAQSSVVFRKDAYLAVGGYDESLTTMEDHDLWLKIGKTHELMTLPIHALGYRIHSSGITKSRRLRVALDELAVVLRHRKNYPGIFIGKMKGVARILRALIPL